MYIFALIAGFTSYAFGGVAQVSQKPRRNFPGFDEVKYVPYRQWSYLDKPWIDPATLITSKDLDGKWVLTKARVWRGGPGKYLLNGQTHTDNRDTLEILGDTITDPASNFKVKYHFTLSHNLILIPNPRRTGVDTTTITRISNTELILSSGTDWHYLRRYYIKTRSNSQ